MATASDALVVAGSDLLGADIQAAMKKQAEAVGLDLTLSLEGSLLASRALSNGEVDACILADPADGTMEVSSMRAFPFGFQIVAFAVHSSNPVSDLTYAQLTNLYGESGVLESWSNLTPDPEWRDRNISLWAARTGNAINMEIFNAVVLKGSPLRQSVRYSSGDSVQLVSIVVEDPSAIVLVPSIPLNPGVRLLAIKEDSGGQAYTPSPDNVFFGDYPLRLPFSLMVSDSLSDEDMGKLLQVVYSADVTEALRAANFLPISDTERRSILSQLD